MSTLLGLLPTLALLQQASPCPDKGMSSAHFIYIPAMILVGLVLGFIVGSRAARAEAAAERKKAEARAARVAKAE